MLSIDKKLLFFVIFIIALEVSGKVEKFRYTSIKTDTDSLVFSFEVNNLFNETIVEGLQKGMTTVLEYRIQLWEKRSLWFDKLITEDIIRFKINYDIWGKRYGVFKNNQKPVILDINGVKNVCQRLHNYSLLPSHELKINKEYFVAVKVTLRPVSVENYREIQRWVVGEAKEIDTEVIKEPRKAGEKAGSWLLGLVLNLSGFGDRVILARSNSFFINENQVILQGEKPN
ncbi:MAG: DUF4390 domain-containing protein [bacterium]